MTFPDKASIVSSVLSLVATGAPLSAGVLTQGPTENGSGIIHSVFREIGMLVVSIDMRDLDDHPRTIRSVAVDQIEPALDRRCPVLILLENEHLSASRVTEAICSAIAARTEDHPCTILALTTAEHEVATAGRIMEGLDQEISILMQRTLSENRRLLNAAIGGDGSC